MYQIDYRNSLNLRKSILFFQTPLAMLVISWLTGGFYSFISPYVPSILPYASYLLWFFLSFIISPKVVIDCLLRLTPIVIFMIYVNYIMNDLNKVNILLYFQISMYIFIIYSIYCYYSSTGLKLSRNRIVLLLIFDFTFVGINTLLKLKSNPMLSRLLATSREIVTNLGLNNLKAVGSYAYVYSIVMILLYISFDIFYLNERKNITLKYISFVLLIILLFRTSFSIAILLFFLFFGVIVLLKYIQKNPVLFILLFIFLIFLYFLNIYSIFFRYFANTSFLSETIRVRLLELSDFLSGDFSHSTDLGSRFYYYSKSIESFSNNIFGTSGNFGVYSAGGHSSMLDMFALFGINSLMFLFSILMIARDIVLKTSVKYKSLSIIILIYLFLLSIINTMLFSTIFITSIIFIPFLTLKD